MSEGNWQKEQVVSLHPVSEEALGENHQLCTAPPRAGGAGESEMGSSLSFQDICCLGDENLFSGLSVQATLSCWLSD